MRPGERDELNRLADVFRKLRSAAARTCPELADVALVVDHSIHDSPRHFAACERVDGTMTIYVAPELADEPLRVQRGVLAHELGHAYRMVRELRECAYDAEERAADRAGEKLTGVVISYDRRMVETAGRGVRPRPRGVR